MGPGAELLLGVRLFHLYIRKFHGIFNPSLVNWLLEEASNMVMILVKSYILKLAENSIKVLTRSPLIGGAAKRRATQRYNLGRHSVKFHVPLLVILCQTVTELCASMPAIPLLRTFVQCLITFFLQPTESS